MIPKKYPYAKIEGYEGSCVTDDWDKDGGFDETFYLHLVNLGWEAEEVLEKGEGKPTRLGINPT